MIRIPAMPDAVNDYGATLQFEQHPVIPYPQAILRTELRQLLDVTGQVFGHFFDLFKNPPADVGWKFLQVFDSPWLEAEIMSHVLLAMASKITPQAASLLSG